jgi:hypothetical protein
MCFCVWLGVSILSAHGETMRLNVGVTCVNGGLDRDLTVGEHTVARESIVAVGEKRCRVCFDRHCRYDKDARAGISPGISFSKPLTRWL